MASELQPGIWVNEGVCVKLLHTVTCTHTYLNVWSLWHFKVFISYISHFTYGIIFLGVKKMQYKHSTTFHNLRHSHCCWWRLECSVRCQNCRPSMLVQQHCPRLNSEECLIRILVSLSTMLQFFLVFCRLCRVIFEKDHSSLLKHLFLTWFKLSPIITSYLVFITLLVEKEALNTLTTIQY